VFDINRGKEVREREDKGIVVPLKDEFGKLSEGASITVVGSYSETYRKNLDAFREKQRDEQKEVSERDAQVIIAACAVKEWEGIVAGDKPFPCTTENAVALFSACPWVHDEVYPKIFSRTAFFTQPSGS
jgi:hypothetical protein